MRQRILLAAIFALTIACSILLGLYWRSPTQTLPPVAYVDEAGISHHKYGALNSSVYGYRTIQQDGASVAQRDTINFVGGTTVTDDPTNGVTVVTAGGGGSAGAANGFYGDGSDGAVTADGTSTVTCLGAPGTAYGVAETYTMTRDCFFSSLILSSPATILPSGYRIFVNSRSTVNGHISVDGFPGYTNNPDSGFGGGSGLVSGSARCAGGGPGSYGGSCQGTANNSLGGAGGGNADGGSGGCSGVSRPVAYISTAHDLISAISCSMWGVSSFSGGTSATATNLEPFVGGQGGYGGYTGVQSSMGGGGGGVLVFAALELDGAGSITANGGQGGAQADAGAGSSGGGGVVVWITRDISGWTGTVSANGGPSVSFGGLAGYPGQVFTFTE